MQKLLIIINTIRENKGQEALTSIDVSANLRDDIGFDSLDLAELTVRIEAEFGVDVFDDGLVFTIGEIINKIETK